MRSRDPRPTPGLADRRILIVEDDYFLADDLRKSCEASGAGVVGPAGTVEQAIDLLGRTGTVDAAVLDINLRGELAFAVADALVERGVPFVFTTGYDEQTIPPRFAGIRRFQKPVDPALILQALSA